MLVKRLLTLVSTGAVGCLAPAEVAAQTPDGAAIVRLLGARAQHAFAPPGSPGIGAIVRLPNGTRASDLGLRDLAPGLARLWGTPPAIVSFATAHPDLHLEVSPPLHLLLDTAARFVGAPAAAAAGFDGKNVVVGVADTGIDLTHPGFLDSTGGTRVQWLLDLSAPPRGVHPELESQYGSTDADGNLVAGAIWSKADINALLAMGSGSPSGGMGLPQDEIGHGTLVASCAAGQDPRYRGIAPQASLVVARITGAGGSSIGNDELLRGVQFLFDRADALGMPVVVNLSIGTDFGPHDGSLAWEQALASQVGAAHPGHALVVAAGNSGSIAETPVHQNVHVTPGPTIRVPLLTRGAPSEGSVQIWITMHAGANLRVGLDSPDGTWIEPVSQNDAVGKNASAFSAAIYNGSRPGGSPVPSQSHGAVVVWQGQWPAGAYYVTLSGSGTADLYVQGTGDVSNPGDVAFADGVRESTVNLPATHPDIIGVGCTINKISWRSAGGLGIGLQVPVLDPAGGEPDPAGATRDPVAGEPCWFSSAGPTLTGVPKPEIMAPGAAIVGALSQQAIPSISPTSIFSDCPPTAAGAANTTCQEIDSKHGVSAGTSFSAPVVAGAVALLLERDPTLTQDRILAALQAGAHRLRVPLGGNDAFFDDQAGAGELDVQGSLSALDRLKNSSTALPVRSESWMTLGADVCLADGSTPLEAVIELRAAPVSGSPLPADGFGQGRLLAYAKVDDAPLEPPPIRRVAPGVWVATVTVPAGLGGSRLTVGATFDGSDIVDSKSVAIATDAWNALYPPSPRGGCVVAPPGAVPYRGASLLVLVVAIAIAKRISRT